MMFRGKDTLKMKSMKAYSAAVSLAEERFATVGICMPFQHRKAAKAFTTSSEVCSPNVVLEQEHSIAEYYHV
jgi:hypothetical protein